MPGLHPTNHALFQRLKSADSQHFTRNMQVVGTVSSRVDRSSKWEPLHLIGVRTDIWQPTPQEVAESLENLRDKRRDELRRDIKKSGRLNRRQTELLNQRLEEDEIMQSSTDEIINRRLVLKLFKNTGSRTTWCGTLEQVTTLEIQHSLGARVSLISMAVMLPRCDFVPTIQEANRAFRLPAVFSFSFHDDREMHYVTLSRRWVSFGPDFDVAVGNRRVGLINGRWLGLGSDASVELAGHPLVRNGSFVDLLTLFAASIGYHRAMRRSIQRRVEAVQGGRTHEHQIEDEEIRLRHNGRSAA